MTNNNEENNQNGINLPSVDKTKGVPPLPSLPTPPPRLQNSTPTPPSAPQPPVTPPYPQEPHQAFVSPVNAAQQDSSYEEQAGFASPNNYMNTEAVQNTPPSNHPPFAPQNNNESPKKSKKLFLILGSVIIVALIGGIGFLFLNTQKNNESPNTGSTTENIKPDTPIDPIPDNGNKPEPGTDNAWNDTPVSSSDNTTIFRILPTSDLTPDELEDGMAVYKHPSECLTVIASAPINEKITPSVMDSFIESFLEGFEADPSVISSKKEITVPLLTGSPIKGQNLNFEHGGRLVDLEFVPSIGGKDILVRTLVCASNLDINAEKANPQTGGSLILDKFMP